MDFYNTFGGLNNSLGTASTFVLGVDPEDTEIYFSRPNGGYELVLIKADSTGAVSYTHLTLPTSLSV